MHNCRPRWYAATVCASLLCATPALAQAGLGHLGDASSAPKGMLRLQAAAAWSRYDARFGLTGVQPLGGLFTADSLGARQLPRLAVAESLVREASGAPFSLTLGRSRLDATAREEVLPLISLSWIVPATSTIIRPPPTLPETFPATRVPPTSSTQALA